MLGRCLVLWFGLRWCCLLCRGYLSRLVPALYLVAADGDHALGLPVLVCPFTPLQGKGYRDYVAHAEIVKLGALVARYLQRDDILVLAAFARPCVVRCRVKQELALQERTASRLGWNLDGLTDFGKSSGDLITHLYYDTFNVILPLTGVSVRYLSYTPG